MAVLNGTKLGGHYRTRLLRSVNLSLLYRKFYPSTDYGSTILPRNTLEAAQAGSPSIMASERSPASCQSALPWAVAAVMILVEPLNGLRGAPPPVHAAVKRHLGSGVVIISADR
jgi:hypothetical protein